MSRLRDWLAEPSIRGVDPDSPQYTIAHREILRRKRVLRTLYVRFYQQCYAADHQYFGTCPGLRLEIGSGAGLIKEVFPDVLTSDLKPLPFIDLVARSEDLPLRDESLRAIYAINVFHHLPRPRQFFAEALRVLHPGGGVVLIEPHYGLTARILFKYLHPRENYDLNPPTWERMGSVGPMANANQALSYVVFVRDRTTLSREFPQLELLQDEPHTHLLYVLSGGLNFKQLVPNALTGAVVSLERWLSPLNSLLAIQHTVVLRKRL